jgi:thiosulfate/3-mercaptopyruvate sulfurtransferase
MTSTADPPSHGILVQPGWLAGMLGRDGVHLVDLRPHAAYAEGHVPGAVQLDLDRLGASRDGCDNVLLAPDAFEALMEELGVTTDGTVVAYDDQWGLAAARLVWALHFYSHEAAAVLDGGWDRWLEEGRPAERDAAVPRRGRFEAAVRPAVGADFDWLDKRVRERAVRILDTRTPAEYEQGHLPGATCWDWFNAVPAASWSASRDPEEIRRELHGMDLTTEDEVVVYCRSGMRAAHTYVVLKHAGYGSVRLYDGSWQDWTMRTPGSAHG